MEDNKENPYNESGLFMDESYEDLLYFSATEAEIQFYSKILENFENGPRNTIVQ